jgi:hypothetical protein
MSMTVFDPDYVASDARPLRARPLGSLAATMIGGGALVILFAALAFGGRPAGEGQSAARDADGSFEAALAAAAAPGGVGPALDLAAPQFAKEKKEFALRAGEAGTAREDSLTLGRFAFGGPFLRLDAAQSESGKFVNSDFFLDMHRRAERTGLAVVRIHSPSPLATRFGAFEAADIQLARPAENGAPAAERSCLAARLLNQKASLEFAAIACGAATAPIDRRAMSCILDGVEYRGGGDNKALEAFLARANAGRRQSCADVTGSIATDKANWFDAHSSAPPVKAAAPAPKPAAPEAARPAPAAKAVKAPVKSAAKALAKSPAKAVAKRAASPVATAAPSVPAAAPSKKAKAAL